MIETVIKGDGLVEPFTPNKLNGESDWAAKALGTNTDKYALPQGNSLKSMESWLNIRRRFSLASETTRSVSNTGRLTSLPILSSCGVRTRLLNVLEHGYAL